MFATSAAEFLQTRRVASVMSPRDSRPKSGSPSAVALTE
jgi:hypothetical protein